MIVLLEVMQPSLPTIWAVIPLPLSTTSRFPALSKMTPRAAPMPPLTFVALHPLAVTPSYFGAGTPGQDSGTGRVECVGVALVVIVEVVGGGDEVDATVEVGLAVLLTAVEVSVDNKFAFTHVSNSGLRAALMSCSHLEKLSW